MDLLLVGGGHAHLGILRKIRLKAVDYQVTLISASTFQYYSGMFSGFTEGLYAEQEIRINLAELCEQAGVTFVEDTIVKIDATNRKLVGATGKVYDFKLVSFDIGSSIGDIDGSMKQIKIKPNFVFPKEIHSFRETEFPVVVGGGAAGVEMALSVQAWRLNNGFKPNVTVITSSPLLSSVSEKASSKIMKIVKQKGIVVYEDEIKETFRQQLITKHGKRIECSQLLPLTGAKASTLFADSSLPLDENGFLLVDSTLQATDFPWVFGAGDCVSLRNNPKLPKNGVYAVRQEPVLWDNINRYLAGKHLVHFKPQKKFLSILSVGQQQGLFTYGDNAFYGKWAWRLKHSIDVKFMAKHR
jgi:NADH dehydrogenase FAD-containing subunit